MLNVAIPPFLGGDSRSSQPHISDNFAFISLAIERDIKDKVFWSVMERTEATQIDHMELEIAGVLSRAGRSARSADGHESIDQAIVALRQLRQLLNDEFLSQSCPQGTTVQWFIAHYLDDLWYSLAGTQRYERVHKHMGNTYEAMAELLYAAAEQNTASDRIVQAMNMCINSYNSVIDALNSEGDVK